MSEKTYTEKEVVLREREAFRAGASAVFVAFGIDPWGHRSSGEWQGSEHIARARYPLPKVTRPRVVTCPKNGAQFRVIDGELQGRDTVLDGWLSVATIIYNVTPDRVALWADLLANPTEEVEE